MVEKILASCGVGQEDVQMLQHPQNTTLNILDLFRAWKIKTVPNNTNHRGNGEMKKNQISETVAKKSLSDTFIHYNGFVSTDFFSFSLCVCVFVRYWVLFVFPTASGWTQLSESEEFLESSF